MATKARKSADKANEVADFQATLFAQTSDSSDLTFVRINTEVQNVGDEYSFTLGSATYNTDKGCLTAFDGTGNALGVHIEHSEALRADAESKGYTLGQTDAEKLAFAANAVKWFAGTTAADMHGMMNNLAAAINTHPDAVLTVRGVETKSGHMARVWSINC